MSILGENTPAARILGDTQQQLPVLQLVHRPGHEATEITSRLEQVDDEELLGRRVVDPQMATAVRAGLLVRADSFDEAHAVSQDLPTREGSYWHGILHRREPDGANAKYWFQRVGDHPLFAELPRGKAIAELAAPPLDTVVRAGRWDPFIFVDLCTSGIHGGAPDLRETLEHLQAAEIEALLAYCYRGAVGG